MNSKQGLSIVELLIAAAIFGTILLLIGQGLQSSGRAVGVVISENELLEDLRASGQMVNDELAKAVYVYPLGASISLGAGGAKTMINPNTDNNTWTIGTDPILAFIQAPQDPLFTTSRCEDLNDNNDASEAKRKKVCLYFVTYYAMERATFLLSVGDEKQRKAMENITTDESWVLLEYRKRLNYGHLSTTQRPLSEYRNARGNFVADNLTPQTGFAIAADTLQCRDFEGRTNDCKDTQNDNNLDYRVTVLSGELELQASISKGSSTTQTPVLSFAIAPRALYSARE